MFSGIQPQQRCCVKVHLLPASALSFVIVRLKQLLGMRTTEIYLRVDPSEKLEAMEAVLPPSLRRGRFKAPDALIAFLQGSP
jgi:hypothetical protein